MVLPHTAEYIPLQKRSHRLYERYERDFPASADVRRKLTSRLWGAYRRCYDPRTINFQRWGGCGIKICEEWYDSERRIVKPRPFILWAISNGWKPGLSLDRIDNDGNYSLENCRWVTHKENNRNRSTNKVITYKGATHCLKEWSEILNIPYGILKQRSSAGMNVDRMFTLPIQDHKRKLTYNGKTLGFREWDRELGLPRGTVYDRIFIEGWSVEKALSEKNKHGHNRFIDFQGESKSIKEWSETYKIPYRCLLDRLRRKWGFHKAITTPVDVRHRTRR